MNSKFNTSLIVIAFIIILIGVTFSFIPLECIGIKPSNSGYVSAIFSLSGVLLFYAALVYQIKEYKLQVEELKKSVEAQTKSSEALDEQKNILLEQNTNSVLFGMIDNFNSFKVRNNSDTHIDKWHAYYQKEFKKIWVENSDKFKLTHDEFNIQFAQNIKTILTETFPNYYDAQATRKYVQFAYNILYLIDKYFPNEPDNIFRPFFFSQLNSKEIAVIYYSNLIDSGIPLYNNLFWDYYTTTEIIDLTKKSPNLPQDLHELDCRILLEEFNKLGQSLVLK